MLIYSRNHVINRQVEIMYVVHLKVVFSLTLSGTIFYIIAFGHRSDGSDQGDRLYVRKSINQPLSKLLTQTVSKPEP